MSSPQRSNKPDLVHLLESLEKDIFYALKRTQHVTTFGGIVLADAVKAKFPDVNTKELNRLIAKAKFSSNAFAKLNVHQHGTLELGSKWIMFRSDPQREVAISPFDQLNPLKARDKNVAASSVDRGLGLVQKSGGNTSQQDGASPLGGDKVDPPPDPGHELDVNKNVATAVVDSGEEKVQKNETSQDRDSRPEGGLVDPLPDHREELEGKGKPGLQSTVKVPENDATVAQVTLTPTKDAGVDSDIEEKAILFHMNFMLLCLQTVQEL